MGLRVSLARCHDIGSRIFQHGDQEWKHIALGVHVLDSLEHRSPLPFPPVGLLFEIPSVTLPKSDVASGKPFTEVLLVNPCDKRMDIAEVLCPESVLYRFPVIAHFRHDIRLQFVLSYEQIPDVIVGA